MNKLMKVVLLILSYLGIRPGVFFQNLRYAPAYVGDFFKFSKKRGEWKIKLYPILTDKTDQSGKARGVYFFQDLFVAHEVFRANPRRHVDIGSRIDGFVAHVASFREIEILDIRPLENSIFNVQFVQADLMKPQPQLKASTDSLSCLHTIEHFGLGRYGDPIDPDGHIKGLDSMYELLEPGGTFYFSTQIGPSCVHFNAHRVFSIQYLLDLLLSRYQYELQSFSYIDDRDQLYKNVELTEELIQSNAGCKLGCGIFILKKRL
ncbi:DUF268 domain-containing protein [Jiulongibacter sediminis]|uniref:DUF268 domain-containing protein n=1 Tax=Jiulongibacter sediminis TaxID=1605367 RepID=A0A0N8HA69_9BACT|nr:DUF268 domain-containing protein [Jiulongibacter sediminis]KPM49340.1 hypothetical protein AFM12_01580 [Jiulongibacter sediminis]